MSSSGKQQQEIEVSGKEAGGRLDRVLAERSELSRTRLKALILAGEVAVGGRTVRDPSHKVHADDVIMVNVPEPEAAEPSGEDIPLKIVFEDEAIIVIDKPAGLVVHPAAGHATGTLVNALIAHCGDSLSGIGGVKRPGIVHRLDKDTTGLMVVAKTDRAHQALAAQFADHGRTGPLKRAYLAFAWGAPPRPKGTVDAPLGRHPTSRDKIAIRKDGRHAVTHWQVLERYVLERYPSPGSTGKASAPAASLIECRLETGRTHQIRVHLAHIGHPLMGDPVYGPGFRTKAARLPPDARAALEGLGRQALHAYLLAVQHPTTGQQLEFRSELPGDLARLHHSLVTSAATATDPPSGRPKKLSRTKG
ncbi:MAG: RluA family pseudouridine synthase [Xanthobacteraceae bacterium]|nr:RluA family pseudouridine synthase [Xanthobacteraceae bacterium]